MGHMGNSFGDYCGPHTASSVYLISVHAVIGCFSIYGISLHSLTDTLNYGPREDGFSLEFEEQTLGLRMQMFCMNAWVIIVYLLMK